MERGRKRRCLRDKEKGQEMNSCSADYFGVGRDATSSKVDMRVDYRNKNIGKFFHRIYEEPIVVMAVFLVEIISHYGGRKPQKGGRKYKEMNLRALAHEIFNRLPDIPKHLDEYLNKYIPDKEYRKVPDVYKLFIIETWNKHKEEVLRLFDICVAVQRLHPSEQGLTQTITSIAFHGEPEPLTEEMEIDKGEASRTLLEQIEDLVQRTQELTLENERLKASDHENKKTIVELRSQLSFIRSNNMCCIHCNTTTNENQGLWSTHIDKCLSDTSPMKYDTRARVDKIPSKIPCEEVVPIEEEEMPPHFEIPRDWEYLYSQDGEQPPSSMALLADLEYLGDFLGDIPADLSENDLSEL